MVNSLDKIPEWTDVDVDTFNNEIVPLNRPAILKSLASDWPAVANGRTSPQAIADYLKKFDNGSLVQAVVGDPGIKGRFFYRDDLQDVNFTRTHVTVSIAADRLIKVMEHRSPYAIAIQGVPLSETLPGFAQQNPQSLLDNSILPTMWMGNQGMVAAHYDIHDNIACVVAGARQFTLFPPDQIKNLYVGPILNAPGGVPISMVDLKAPDLRHFPRFAQALEVAQQAVLEPGDAIYIPALWWHAVESLQSFNLLVNYWWGGLSQSGIPPKDSLMHSILSIGKLSPEKRAAWQSFFDYHVFQTDCDPPAHFPPGVLDVVTSLSPEQKEKLYQYLAEHLE